MSPALAGEFIPMEPPGKPLLIFFKLIFFLFLICFCFFEFYVHIRLLRATAVFTVFGARFVYLSSVPVYIPCADTWLQDSPDGACGLLAKVWLQLQKGLGTEGGAVLVWLASECGPFSVVCCPQGRGLPEHCSSERPGGPCSLASSPRDSYSSAVYHQAEGGSILLQKELKLGVRCIWLWVLVLRLTSCMTLE